MVSEVITMDNFKKALYKHTGERLRRARMMRGMSQTELAQAVGYTDSTTIYKIEKGLQKIPNAKIQKMCYVLGIEPGYLTEGFDFRITPEGKITMVESIGAKRDALIREGMNYLYNATPSELTRAVDILRIIVGGDPDERSITDMEQ